MSKSTRQYMADVKRALGISSDYALAKHLGVTRWAAALLVKGESVMSTTTAAKVAEVLELDPLQVIADAELERGSSPELWKRIRNAAAIAGAAIAGAVLYQVLAGGFDINGIAAAFVAGFPVGNATLIHIGPVILAGAAVLALALEISLARSAYRRRACAL